MGVSEIVVLLLVYSGLMIFFLVPLQSRVQSKYYQQSQVSFISVFKDNLVKMVIHKKAVLAAALLGFMLISIWAGYANVEWHYNAHSGYFPVSTKLTAIYSICGVLIYTLVLLLFLGYLRTLKIVKNANK
ncbi:hypothetical protein MKZ26_09570 [Sporosarcina sp. FSL K6-6792]|uniref:hypothetical protein n=1 Tax=Sporosarcina sp. FSL K6-6792 TaxID=2921559 RepID=UPI0030FBA946